MRAHVAEDCKNDYAAQLQKYNKEQHSFYFNEMPLIFNVSYPLFCELSKTRLNSVQCVVVFLDFFSRNCKTWMRGEYENWGKVTSCFLTLKNM